MKPRFDFTGRRFGKLRAVEFSGSKVGAIYTYRWRCSCDCGGESSVLAGHLKSGAVSDCGCGKRTRHGLSQKPVFRAWCNMHSRCSDPKNRQYDDYGGRGITVCDQWAEFDQFLQDLGEPPEGYTLERVDNSLGYSPENCVWADRLTQASNKRNVPLYDLGGVRMSVAQWARARGLRPETLRSRLKAGVPLAEALTQGNRRWPAK